MILKKSSRPVQMIGGGVRSAEAIEDLHELGNILNVLCTLLGTR